MKLILTQEVTNLGGAGDVVDVKDGYGRNYLMPQGYAIRWTRGGQKQVDSIKTARKVREIRDVDQAEDVKSQLESLDITVAAQAGRTGRLFGSVTVTAIVAAVQNAGGPQIDKRRVQVGNPIKTLGAHQVSVKLHDDVSATLNLQVVSA